MDTSKHAFPCPPNTGVVDIPQGMTLREYYAGEAMKVMAQEVPLENYSPASVKKIFKTRAVLSVMYADALIAELSEERGNS